MTIRKLLLKCDYNDVIMVSLLVLLHVQNCCIYKMIGNLKQINKPRFKSCCGKEFFFFNVVNLFNFYLFKCVRIAQVRWVATVLAESVLKRIWVA